MYLIILCFSALPYTLYVIKCFMLVLCTHYRLDWILFIKSISNILLNPSKTYTQPVSVAMDKGL